MTSAEIRQSFLEFFQSKAHTLIPSTSLMPQSPDLLFTNAGMNPFVSYFLGTEKPAYDPPRIVNTQKCIRAGGKHNDLEDVGYDSFHHTFFEMLGNWSFNNSYFKREAIEWSWELMVERWDIPANRLYATVYAPAEGEPSVFDEASRKIWERLFTKAGLDPEVHIVNGRMKDNFWMMGETGPCGPCSELHIDLTPDGNSRGALVNKDSDLCIELWNLVFIQYNAEADGRFRDLGDKHVDTGMGFERICSIIQNTKSFTDFSKKPGNYTTDIFQPIFRRLQELSGKRYVDIYPNPKCSIIEPGSSLAEAIAFRVIADHIRTLSFSLADGILPGNTGRNYVLRRILRRAVRYGRTLGFSGRQTFLAELVDTLAEQFGPVFPEIKTRAETIKNHLNREEVNFNKTLDRGLAMFEEAIKGGEKRLCGRFAFKLYDTYGFPIDLTQLLCSEHGIQVDMAVFEEQMAAQRERARGARSRQIIQATGIETEVRTDFIGFDNHAVDTSVIHCLRQENAILVFTKQTPFYAELGGQVGDQGTLRFKDKAYPVSTVRIFNGAPAHSIEPDSDGDPNIGIEDKVCLSIDRPRRKSIEKHHTATHLLHWALREIVSPDTIQQGSMVGPKHLRFDFNSGALHREQINDLETRVNRCIEAGDPVSWKEFPHASVKGRKDIRQFFGDKYGEAVRVVQIGGEPGHLNGYSMEFCGGTHVSNTSEIGLFKIKSESAIASGIRRIEAVCGDVAEQWMLDSVKSARDEADELRNQLETINEQLKNFGAEPVQCLSLPSKIDGSWETGNFEQKNAIHIDTFRSAKAFKVAVMQANKALKKARITEATKIAHDLIKERDLSENLIFQEEGSAGLLEGLLNGLKSKQFSKAAFCIVNDGKKLHLGALVQSESDYHAGRLIQMLAPIAGGKGGGKPGLARGAAPQIDKAPELEARARELLKIT